MRLFNTIITNKKISRSLLEKEMYLDNGGYSLIQPIFMVDLVGGYSFHFHEVYLVCRYRVGSNYIYCWYLLDESWAIKYGLFVCGYQTNGNISNRGNGDSKRYSKPVPSHHFPSYYYDYDSTFLTPY